MDVGNFGVGGVVIQAVAKSDAAMLWQGATVSFYKNGVLTDSASLDSFGPDLRQNPGIAEQIISVIPTKPDNTKMVISGTFRMQCPEGFFPGENDIWSLVWIRTTPLPEVSIAALDASATENADGEEPDPAVIRVSRSVGVGDSEPLDVELETRGTATRGNGKWDMIQIVPLAPLSFAVVSAEC